MPSLYEQMQADAGAFAPAVPLSILARMRADAAAAAPMDVNPAGGGSTLQVGPFDTSIPLGENVTNFLAGTGQGMTNLARGVGQRLGMVSEADVADTRRRDAALDATASGKAGNFAGTVAALAPMALVPGANTYAGATLLGVGSGALAPSADSGEQLGNTLTSGAGGVLGTALGRGAGALIDKLPSASGALTAAQRQALELADALGLKTTAAQKSGSRALGQIEAFLESHAATSGPFNSIKDANQKVLNTIAAKSIGVESTELSAPVLAEAKNKIGAVYDAVATKKPVALDPDGIVNSLASIEKEFEGQYAGAMSISDNALVKNLLNHAASGTATAEQLSTMSSNLGKAASNQMTSASGDRSMGQALFATKEVVDDALQGSLSPEMQKAFAEARGQYRNLMNLTTRSNVVNPASGNVNPKALAAALMSKDRGGYTFGGNGSDLYNAARVSQAFPAVAADSGTATRGNGGLTSLLMNMGGAVGSRALYANPVAQMGIRAGISSPQALAKLLGSDPMSYALPAFGAAGGASYRP